MQNRRIQRSSGLVLEEINEATIDWSFQSRFLGRISGQLEYSDWHGGGWSITGLPTTPSGGVTIWLIPIGLMEAVEMIEEKIDAAEKEAIKPSAQEERRKSELDSLFESGPVDYLRPIR